MNGRYLILAAVVVAFAAVVWLMDPFLLFILGVAPLLWIGLPASLFAGILLLVAIRTGRSRRPALIILSVVAAFGCFVGLAIPTNHFIQQRAVAAAKEYPARVAPLLEAYRQDHGSYPTSLDQLPAKPVVPRLLRSSYGYRSDGSSYSFCFGQPGGLIDTWDYDSETQTWHLST
ncbi:MAG TPA: hypothetical protein VIS99_17065 [Terrimicrobiaceae bacterium]